MPLSVSNCESKLMDRPDGFDEAMWNVLTDKQQRHVSGYASNPETLLKGEEMSQLALNVYAQCWKAMKGSIFTDGLLVAQITLEQMEALEQYCLTGILNAFAAQAKAQAEKLN